MTILQTENLPDGGRVEHLTDGRVLTKNADGKIVGTYLPPELAAQMGRKRFSDELQEGSAALLADAGFSDSNQAPSWVVRLSEEIAKGGSNIAANVREFVKLSGLAGTESATFTPPVPGQPFTFGGWCYYPINQGEINETVLRIFLSLALDRAAASDDEQELRLIQGEMRHVKHAKGERALDPEGEAGV